jgi:hypothetical protein
MVLQLTVDSSRLTLDSRIGGFAALHFGPQGIEHARDFIALLNGRIEHVGVFREEYCADTEQRLCFGERTPGNVQEPDCNRDVYFERCCWRADQSCS